MGTQDLVGDILACSFYTAVSAQVPWESFTVCSSDSGHDGDDLSRKMLTSALPDQAAEPMSSVALRVNACGPSLFSSGFLNIFVLVYCTPDKHQKASPVGERKKDPVT